MIHELREFCEDNNQAPPAPWRSVPVRPELSYWSGADPALDIEADPALELRAPGGRTFYVQRVIYDIRYSLWLENGVEFERGTVPSVAIALQMACVWLGGGALVDLPRGRSVLV